MNWRKTVPTQQGLVTLLAQANFRNCVQPDRWKVRISYRPEHLCPKLQSSKFLLICCHTLEVPKLRRRQHFTLKFPRLLKFCCGHVQKCRLCHGIGVAHSPALSDPRTQASCRCIRLAQRVELVNIPIAQRAASLQSAMAAFAALLCRVQEILGQSFYPRCGKSGFYTLLCLRGSKPTPSPRGRGCSG